MGKKGKKRKGLASRQKELRRNDVTRKRNEKRDRVNTEISNAKKRRKKMLQARSPYKFRKVPSTNILLLGEGNFSFTRALIGRVGEGNECSLIATAFDDATSLEAKCVRSLSLEQRLAGSRTLRCSSLRHLPPPPPLPRARARPPARPPALALEGTPRCHAS